MLRVITFLLALFLVAVGVAFASLNSMPVALDFYYVQVELALPVLLVIVLMLGVLLGMMSATGYCLRQRRELSRLRRDVKVAEEEINNLRTLPLKDA